LKSLYLDVFELNEEEVTSIAKALTYNPTLLILEFVSDHIFCGLQEFKDTFHTLQDLLNILIGEEGSQVLGTAFHIKSRCVT
jgi:hypothetical protein